jgi:hypothetical protein
MLWVERRRNIQHAKENCHGLGRRAAGRATGGASLHSVAALWMLGSSAGHEMQRMMPVMREVLHYQS